MCKFSNIINIENYLPKFIRDCQRNKNKREKKNA